jgi:hypothetical protein
LKIRKSIQKPEIEKGKTIKWPKEREKHKEKQKTKDRATRTPLKTVMKLSVYFTSHKRIVEKIINNIHGQFHVFIQGYGSYKDKNGISIFTSRCYQSGNIST